MERDQATARPWKIQRGKIIAGNSEILGVVYGTEAWSTGEKIRYEEQANAALVVRAVNAHDDLAAALESTLAHAALFNRDTDDAWLAIRDAARAALSKSGEIG